MTSNWIFIILLGLVQPAVIMAGGGHGEHLNDHDHGEEDGLVRITDVGMEVSNIELEKAETGTMNLSLEANGYVIPNRYETSQIHARFPGVVKSVLVQLGEKVKKGQRLAVVQANGSEANFSVISGFSGTVTTKDVVRGQFVSVEHIMFTVSNLNKVWVHLSIPESHTGKVKKGHHAKIIDWTGKNIFHGKISFVSSTIYKDSQSSMVRLEVGNANGVWRPGLFVKSTIIYDSIENVVTVKKSSLQNMDGRTIVFIEIDEGVFQPQNVETGSRNSELVEIVSGLKPGERYVSKNSYILKADFLKSEASHEH